MTLNPTVTEIVEAEGHLIDSQLMNAMFDTVVRHGAAFDVLEFRIGRTNDEPSFVSMRVTARSPAALTAVLEELVRSGAASQMRRTPTSCRPIATAVRRKTSTRRRITGPRCASPALGRGRSPAHGRGDRRSSRAARSAGSCATYAPATRSSAASHGIKVVPEFQARDRHGFAFMTNEISSERRVEVGVARIAAMMREAKQAGGRIAFVAGPVVVHTGGGTYFCELIRRGYVDVLLAGNALAVHDVEQALFGTSLGVDLETGERHRGRPPPSHARDQRDLPRRRAASGGRAGRADVGRDVRVHPARRRLRARRQHSRRRSAARHGHGSRRSAGPLHGGAAGRDLVLVLSTMLHGIGVGNMLPAWVPLVCVDINPAVVTKLADRGSSQTIGLVTDVGLFLRQLASALND